MDSNEPYIQLNKKDLLELLNPDLIDHEDIVDGFWWKFIQVIQLILTYIWLPLLVYLLYKWNPSLGHDEYGKPEKPFISIAALVWLYLWYQYRKNRLIVKKLEKYKKHLGIL